MLDLATHVLQSYETIFDFDNKKSRLHEINLDLESPAVWSDQVLSQQLSREKAAIVTIVEKIESIDNTLSTIIELYPMALADSDIEMTAELEQDFKKILKKVEALEFHRMFHNASDSNNAYIEVQSGSGGTEAQDWAQMLQRMYIKWADNRGFSAAIIDEFPGEVAGIKSCTLHLVGDYAYGWARSETGVHRLVRKSPFDSGSRRHTSFASVFVTPEIDDDVEIDINPADLRIDTYRASGAGGQHVNTTDSAIRITHVPSDTVVQCQSDRSQHKNKAQAMKQLRAKLHQLELNKRNADRQKLEAGKSDISWGNQIRSYVLDDSRIKDLRTGVEVSSTQSVLDGGIDVFIEAWLQSNMNKGEN
ncbi:MAG: peptide chain release factor 2 [Legionellales bacterium]|jgi:peptide chain release factor 2|nr:peptide chain release factor 2 [Legionellales bacterium]|tara:strand:- start:1047 stop:2132 length:1086 start_codon:yes stop_codon:yes gene_type:complete